MINEEILSSELRRSLRLLTWWGAQPAAARERLAAAADRLRLHAAALVPAGPEGAIQALRDELADLSVEADATRDPQKALAAYFEIAAAIRRCGTALAQPCA